MKCFVIVMLSMITLHLGGANQILEAFDVCGKEANVSEHTKLNVDDATYECIVKCVYTKLGVHDADGNVVIPELEKVSKRKFTDDQMSKIGDCEEKYKNANLCRRVAKTENCIAKIFHNIQ